MRVMKSMVTWSLVLALVAGCTTNPYTGEKEAGKAGEGAGIGALAGAVIGAFLGGDAKQRRKNALIGAGVGAIAGGGAGYYMDVQEAKLRKQLQGTGVSVTRNGDSITLNMPGNVTFQSASADLNPGFFRVLDSVGLVLKEYDKTLIDVSGHTDSTGASEMNQQLSQKRAEAVATYLATRDIAAQRMVISGYGETRPVASNSTPEGRQQNRRVELTLEPLTKTS